MRSFETVLRPMRIRILLVLAALLLAHPLLSEGYGTRPSEEFENVSIYKLEALAEQMQGKLVVVEGFFVADFEAPAVCPTLDAARYGLLGQCVALDLDFERLGLTEQKFKGLDQRVIQVAGKVRYLPSRIEKKDVLSASGQSKTIITYVPIFAAELSEVSYVYPPFPADFKGRGTTDESGPTPP